MYRNRKESLEGIKQSGLPCVICGWAKKDAKGRVLTEGAHIREFHGTGDYDKSDNIISLCPNHHKEFDAGNITIDPEKKICIHINSKDEFNNKPLLGSVAHIQPGYFDYHTKHVFKGLY